MGRVVGFAPQHDMQRPIGNRFCSIVLLRDRSPRDRSDARIWTRGRFRVLHAVFLHHVVGWGRSWLVQSSSWGLGVSLGGST